MSSFDAFMALCTILQLGPIARSDPTVNYNYLPINSPFGKMQES